MCALPFFSNKCFPLNRKKHYSRLRKICLIDDLNLGLEKITFLGKNYVRRLNVQEGLHGKICPSLVTPDVFGLSNF